MQAINTIKLIKRNGMHRVYESDKGFIWVGVCTNPNVYVEPGYYVSPEKRIPDNVSKKRYSSAKQAALAAYNSIN